MARVLAWLVQVEAFGEPARVRRVLASMGAGSTPLPGRRVKPGCVIMREWNLNAIGFKAAPASSASQLSSPVFRCATGLHISNSANTEIRISGLETDGPKGRVGGQLPPLSPSPISGGAGKAPKQARFLPRGGKLSTEWTGWLGREDSNLRMAESKSAALPLGDAPMRGGP
jgi:hypothetical protein